MKTHTIKFKGKELCDAVYSGRKTHEIRLNDRDYAEGDLIEPIAVDSNCNPIAHPINNVTYKIGFVSEEWKDVIADGYCVFSIRVLEDRNLTNSTKEKRT